MMRHQRCDQPDCNKRSQWFVGREFFRAGEDLSRGHTACDEHLADACWVTLKQLRLEGETDARLDVRWIESVAAVVR